MPVNKVSPKAEKKSSKTDLARARARKGIKDSSRTLCPHCESPALSATDKALLIYHHTNRTEFDFDFGNRLYWFELKLTDYHKAKEELEQAQEEGGKHMGEKEMREKALQQSTVLKPIANCLPRALYFQRNEVTQEAWYYFSIALPHDDRHLVKGTFTPGQEQGRPAQHLQSLLRPHPPIQA